MPQAIKARSIEQHLTRRDLVVHKFECTNCEAVQTKILLRKDKPLLAQPTAHNPQLIVECHATRLVMIEAMACGTPVLAFRCGSTPEIIEDGVTGELVGSEEEAVAALPKILSYDRRAVRQRFEERFTATRMAKDYVSAYRQLLGIGRPSGDARRSRSRRLDLNSGKGLVSLTD